jgi:hypothetical protein
MREACSYQLSAKAKPVNLGQDPQKRRDQLRYGWMDWNRPLKIGVADASAHCIDEHIAFSYSASGGDLVGFTL